MLHWKKTQFLRQSARAHAHTRLHTWWKTTVAQSVSVLRSPGRFPTNSPGVFFSERTWSNQARKTVNIQYMCSELTVPQESCPVDETHTLTLADRHFSNAAQQPCSHMELGDTHPPFHTQINTDQSRASLYFSIVGPRLVNLDVGCSGIWSVCFLFQTWLCSSIFILFLCSFIRGKKKAIINHLFLMVITVSVIINTL